MPCSFCKCLTHTITHCDSDRINVMFQSIINHYNPADDNRVDSLYHFIDTTYSLNDVKALVYNKAGSKAMSDYKKLYCIEKIMELLPSHMNMSISEFDDYMRLFDACMSIQQEKLNNSQLRREIKRQARQATASTTTVETATIEPDTTASEPEPELETQEQMDQEINQEINQEDPVPVQNVVYTIIDDDDDDDDDNENTIRLLLNPMVYDLENYDIDDEEEPENDVLFIQERRYVRRSVRVEQNINQRIEAARNRIERKKMQPILLLDKKRGAKSDYRSIECGVCFEDQSSSEYLKFGCSHEFCKNCVTTLFKKQMKQCPMCRSTIDNVTTTNAKIHCALKKYVK